MITKQVKQLIQFPYVQGSLELSQSLSIRLQTLIPNHKDREWGVYNFSLTRYRQHFQNYLVLYHTTECFLYLFFLPCIYSETQNDGSKENDVNKTGGGLESYLEITTIHHRQLKLNWKTTMSLKPPEKVLRIVAGYITKWFQELKHTLCILWASWEVRKLNGQKKMI